MRASMAAHVADRQLWQPALMAVRIGFIGAGLIANYHREMLQTGGADVVWSGVYDIDRTRAQLGVRALLELNVVENDVEVGAADAVEVPQPGEIRRLVDRHDHLYIATR